MSKKELLISEISVTSIEKKILNIVKDFDKETYQNEYGNNVISFVGERGSGKTSMMVSMANLKKEEAIILDLIEPELFENNTRLIEVIISKMYVLFRNEYKKNKELSYTDQDISELNKRIIEILKSIKVYFEKREDYYEKEISINLLEISDCFKIKFKFKELVENYLKVMNRIKNKNYKYMLIMIDDIDLNYKNGYSILEQVRKFLIVPNLINFVAYKESQLTIILENEFHEIEKVDTTQKYLKKLFPYENKIYTNGKQELMEEKEYQIVAKKLDKVFKNILSEEKIEVFYPETYRELRALNSFFETETQNITITKYIKFLGGNVVSEIERLKTKKNYLKELFGIEKKLEEDLNIEEQRINLIKREYILQNITKIKTQTNVNIIENIRPLKIENWDKEHIFYKEDFFESDNKIYNFLYNDIEKRRLRNKVKILKFIDDLFFNKDVIDPLGIFFENSIDLSAKEVYEYLMKIKGITQLDELFDIIISNKLMKEKLGTVIEGIKNINSINNSFNLALFLNINFYKKTRCESFEEIIALILILKKIFWCEMDIMDGIFEVKTANDGINKMKHLKKYLKYINMKIPALQEVTSIYLRKILETTQYMNNLEIMYKKNTENKATNIEEIKLNFEYAIHNKLMNTFNKLDKEVESVLKVIELPYEDWNWIEMNYTQSVLNKILENILADN